MNENGTLHCLGDSHAEVFQQIGRFGLLPNTALRYCIVQGATNMGLANPHSKTRAMPIYEAYLSQNVAPADWMISMLGEVDCGFVIWYRARKYNLSIDEQFSLSLKNYLKLVDRCMGIVKEKVIVTSVPLPTIPDHQLVRGEVANKRLEVAATQKQRTELTSRYNIALRDACAQRKINFLDHEADTLDTVGGVISEQFLNPDPMNHHYDQVKFAALLAGKLNSMGFN